MVKKECENVRSFVGKMCSLDVTISADVVCTYLFQILLSFRYPTEMLNPFKNTKSQLKPPCLQSRSL